MPPLRATVKARAAAEAASGLTVPNESAVADALLGFLVDSTGLKAFGEREPNVNVRGAILHRIARNLNLLVDQASALVVAAVKTRNTLGDASVLPTL